LDRGVKYDAFFFGITGVTRITKLSITGQQLWTFTVAAAPIQDIQIVFNRLAILDGKGAIECRDAQFGVSLWKTELSGFFAFRFQYPIFYALAKTGDISAFDFNSGTFLYSTSPPPGTPAITHLEISSDTTLLALGQSTIHQVQPDTSQWTPIVAQIDSPKMVHASPSELIIALDNIIATVNAANPVKPVYAMGSPEATHYVYSQDLIAATSTPSKRSTWIVDYPLLIEMTPAFSMVRVIDMTSYDTIVEWKEADPERGWKSIWWQNGILSVLDDTLRVNIWDSVSRKTLGTVPWTDGETPPIGMIHTRNVISFISRNKISYALSRN